jgi:hypothetical protein
VLLLAGQSLTKNMLTTAQKYAVKRTHLFGAEETTATRTATFIKSYRQSVSIYKTHLILLSRVEGKRSPWPWNRRRRARMDACWSW